MIPAGMTALEYALEGANQEIARLTRERDEAVAQRDRAVAELKALAHWCNTPIPDKHAAKREAGRRWRHAKRGTEYVEIGRAYLQTGRPVTDMTPMVVYKDDSGLWVRPGIEFEDGRFLLLSENEEISK